MPAPSLLPRRTWLAATGLISLGAITSAWAWGESVKGSGRAITETRVLGSFEAVAVSGPFNVDARQTGKESITLAGDDNVLPLIETVIEPGRQGQTLHIRVKQGVNLQMRTPVKLTLDVARLVSVAVAGAGTVRLNELQTPSLNLAIAGSGDLQLESLSTDRLEAKVAGSGNVRAKGRAAQAKFSISGSGDIDTVPLAADDVTISIAGSGDAKVTANKSLKVSIAGSGDVVWSGSATDVKKSVAGSGSVTRR